MQPASDSSWRDACKLNLARAYDLVLAGCKDEAIGIMRREARTIAAHAIRAHRRHWTLQPSDLAQLSVLALTLGPAYKELVAESRPSIEAGAILFSMVGKISRNVLVDHVRWRVARKRGGGLLKRVSLEAIAPNVTRRETEILLVDEVLDELTREQETDIYAIIIELKFYVGLTVDEIAVYLGMSHAEVDRRWSFARCWLYLRLAPVISRRHTKGVMSDRPTPRQ